MKCKKLITISIRVLGHDVKLVISQKTAQKSYKPILVLLNIANVLTIMSIVASRKDEIFK